MSRASAADEVPGVPRQHAERGVLLRGEPEPLGDLVEPHPQRLLQLLDQVRQPVRRLQLVSHRSDVRTPTLDTRACRDQSPSSGTLTIDRLCGGADETCHEAASATCPRRPHRDRSRARRGGTRRTGVGGAARGGSAPR